MLFEDDRIDAGTRKQQSEHHPGRFAALDATPAGEYLLGLRIESRLSGYFPMLQLGLGFVVLCCAMFVTTVCI
jgi:hypothetical protein